MVTELEFQYGENIIELEDNLADDLECELLDVLTMAFNNEYKQYFNLKVSTFNCHGLKSNIGYTKNLFNKNHVNFICEHWLQPHELSTI